MNGTLFQADAVGLYLDEIGSHRILTAAEEQALGKAIQAGLDAEAELDQAQRVSPERRKQLQAIITAGEAAQVELIACNLKLVASIARRCRRFDEPLSEAIQNGNLGLMTAVRKFDWRKGFKFSTYATWWIRQAIDRGYQNAGQLIRLPSDAFVLAEQVRKAERDLYEQTGTVPTSEQVAGHLNRPVAQVQLVQNAVVTRSIDEPVSDDGPSLIELRAAPEDPEDVEGLVREALGVLDEQDRHLLGLRYGLVTGRRVSEKDTAQLLGITVHQVRRREREALARIRAAMLPAAAA